MQVVPISNTTKFYEKFGYQGDNILSEELKMKYEIFKGEEKSHF